MGIKVTDHGLIVRCEQDERRHLWSGLESYRGETWRGKKSKLRRVDSNQLNKPHRTDLPSI